MRSRIPEIKNKRKEVIAMSLSTASRASTKWLWQQALIRAGGQDIATQLRERRIGCSSINDWLPASSRFSEIVWQLMAFAPTNVSSYFWFSVWEFVGARPLTVFPQFLSLDPKKSFFLSLWWWVQTIGNCGSAAQLIILHDRPVFKFLVSYSFVRLLACP